MNVKIYALLCLLPVTSQYLNAGFTLADLSSKICITSGLLLASIGTAKADTPAQKVMAETLTKVGPALIGVGKDLNNSNTFLSPVLNSINLLDPLHWGCIILGYYFVVKPTVKAGYNYLFSPKPHENCVQKIEIHNHYHFLLPEYTYNKNIKKMLEKPALLGVSPI